MSLKVVLVAPEIPGNTGSIGRTCVALNCELILIHPLGFDLDEKSVRRAGLDYWKHVKLKEYNSWDDFLEGESPRDLFFFSRFATQIYYDAPMSEGSYLVFGSETKGLARSYFDRYPQQFYKLPTYSDEIRSLNLSNCVSAVMYEAIRKMNFL